MSRNFFESVDKYNLERFHSECLTWVFNNYKECTRQFICKVKNIANRKKCNIEIINVLSEVDNIDIKIEYKINNKVESIIIENKIKTTEHFIDNQSQTEYYYNKKNDDNTIFVYLTKYVLKRDEIIKQHKLSEKDLNSINYDFEKQNIWRNDDNPWITISYEDLHKIFKNNRPLSKGNSDAIFNEYVDYISNWKCKASDYLYFKSSKSKNATETSGSNFLYYTLLFHLLLAKLKKSSYKILDYYSIDDEIDDYSSFFYYFKSASANSPDPLFAFFKRIKIDKVSRKYFEILNNKKCKKIDFMNVGIQMQGDTIKYYTSIDDKDYDYVTTTDRDKYMEYSKKTFFKEDILKKISNKFSITKSNNCKTKTFFSKSYHFEDFDKKDIKFNVESIHGVVENFFRIRF
jgi:hypothetical protein